MISGEDWDTRRDAIALELLDQAGDAQDDPGVQYAALLLANRETTELLGPRPEETNS